MQDPPVALVLDDLHVVTEPQVLKEPDFLPRNAGDLRLAVSSRMDPATAEAALRQALLGRTRTWIDTRTDQVIIT